ncbi:uncharacterized protein LOC142985060 [Anticarsia gemmatalis]|uniref:uncharacterized protein LOC142985060 n=1 Tax=Anticarsia gemmatalis TaxID=129554 RepID=UPI003F775E71
MRTLHWLLVLAFIIFNFSFVEAQEKEAKECAYKTFGFPVKNVPHGNPLDLPNIFMSDSQSSIEVDVSSIMDPCKKMVTKVDLVVCDYDSKPIIKEPTTQHPLMVERTGKLQGTIKIKRRIWCQSSHWWIP